VYCIVMSRLAHKAAESLIGSVLAAQWSELRNIGYAGEYERVLNDVILYTGIITYG
jgi:hypothetical protein